MSPSSRRVWIEIIHHHLRPFFFPVALLAEGVDRNSFPVSFPLLLTPSPSSRRAWIEIPFR